VCKANTTSSYKIKEELAVELAITIDVGEALVKATYALEGDGPLVFRCYDVINTVKASLRCSITIIFCWNQEHVETICK